MQVWSLVMMKYPKLEIERRCLIEKKMRDLCREEYKNKLMNELKAEAAILEQERSITEKV